jgi:peptide methionine sulfoxide reductase MsrA
MNNARETAILAGGCFWGVQDLIRKRSGVIIIDKVRAGIDAEQLVDTPAERV